MYIRKTGNMRNSESLYVCDSVVDRVLKSRSVGEW